MKVIGIYHSADLDGFCSAAIIKKKYPDAELIGWNYGDDFPEITEGSTVIMSDISFPMDVMRKISENSKLIWIDHHISAIKAYEQYCDENGGSPFIAYTATNRAACELTWMYFYPDIHVPDAVKLLGVYDSWRNDDKEYWQTKVMPFQYGMRTICTTAETFPEYLLDEYLLEPVIEDTIKTGNTIINYQKLLDERNCRSASFEVVFKGLRAVCLNGHNFSSQSFESVYSESKHDLMMPFQFDGNVWKFSLYSTKDDVDCSVLAKAMGGGGHKGAAGFMVKDLTEVFN